MKDIVGQMGVKAGGPKLPEIEITPAANLPSDFDARTRMFDLSWCSHFQSGAPCARPPRRSATRLLAALGLIFNFNY